jgi:hypothetical protein
MGQPKILKRKQKKTSNSQEGRREEKLYEYPKDPGSIIKRKIRL